MQKEYVVFRCCSCKRYVILITEELKEANDKKIFITCSYHPRHQLKEVGEYDDLKEVLKVINSQNTYTRKNQKVVQKGWKKNV